MIGFLFWPERQRSFPSPPVEQSQNETSNTPSGTISAPQPFTTTGANAGSAHSSVAAMQGPLAQVAAFDRWFTGFRRGEFEMDAVNLARGLDLVQQRREAMKELIKTDPAKALALAMPRDLREELPSQIAGQLEKWVEGVGNLEVMIGCFGTNGQSDTIRKVRLPDGIYDAYVYGRRLTQATKYKLPITGIAVDNQLALDEKPWRRLEPREVLATGFDADSTVLKSGDEVRVSSSSQELEAWESGLFRRESQIGPALPDGNGGGVPPSPNGNPPEADGSNWTFGEKGVIWIRGEFLDDPGLPATDQDITNTMAQVNQYYQDVSNGRCWLRTVVFPGSLMLSKTKAYCNTNSGSYGEISSELLQDARDYDATHGGTGIYNPDLYDRWIVVFKTLTNYWWSGLASVGAKGVWQNGNTIEGVVAHELGHNHGLWHSHSWQPTSTSTINPGTHVEYGDTFDVMGNSGSFPAGHFNAKQKEILLYLSTNQITTVTNKGMYRIYRHDHRSASGVQALKVNAGTNYDYWVEYRQQIPYAGFNQTSRLRNGVILHWGKRPSFTSGTGTYLLDATPLSADYMADAPFALGETFTDSDFGIHITPVGVGGSPPAEWIDVRVDFGNVVNWPMFIDAGTSSAGVPIGRQTIFATSAQGFQSVQFLVNGTVVSEQTGDNPVFTWTPTAFGNLTFSLRATTLDGQLYISRTNIVTSTAMLDWQWLNPYPQVHPLRDIVQGLGRWWGVGDGGAMVTSPDGISWSVMFLADMVNARSVATDGSRLAVVGDVYDSSAGVYRKGILSTTDGLNWQGVNASQLSYADLKGVAYANNLWVAVGASKVFTSSDGLAWTDNALPKQTTFNGVAWGGGRWIVVGNSRTILTSTDGVAWTDVTPTNITSATFYRAAYANGRWVVVGSSGRIANSTDGTNWNSATSGVTSTIYGVADWQGQFIAATSDGKLLSSADGSTWGSVSLSPARSLYAVRAAGSQIVAVGDYGNIFQGNSLATASLVSGGRHNDIYALLPSEEAVIAGGYGFDSDIGTSGAWSGPLAALYYPSNAWQSWTAGTNQQTTVRGLAALGNAYAAVGDSGNIYTSTDRTNWVKQTSGTTSSLRSISAGTSNFVAVGASGRILTSLDGTNWTIQTSLTANTLAAICYGGGQFVAVGTSGTTLTSPDGINWTTRTNGVTQSLNAIIWANGIGYVAVGTSGTVLTSSNGVSWTRQTLDNSDSLSCVASTPWGIVAFTTSYPRAHVSGDGGITWRSLTLPTSAISAAWNNGKGLWIAGTAGRLLYYPFSTEPITSLAFTRQGNSLVLLWPTNDPAFKLFYATNLAATTWISNPVAPAIVSGQYIITNSMTNNARFYRLKK